METLERYQVVDFRIEQPIELDELVVFRLNIEVVNHKSSLLAKSKS